MTGERWDRENFKDEDDAWDAGYLSTRWWQANESVGKCVACEPGRVLDDSTSWPETCTECPSGKFSSIEGGKHCNDCLRNTYAVKGSIKCTTCDFGKTSASNQQSCVRLSYTNTKLYYTKHTHSNDNRYHATPGPSEASTATFPSWVFSSSFSRFLCWEVLL